MFIVIYPLQQSGRLTSCFMPISLDYWGIDGIEFKILVLNGPKNLRIDIGLDLESSNSAVSSLWTWEWVKLAGFFILFLSQNCGRNRK